MARPVINGGRRATSRFVDLLRPGVVAIAALLGLGCGEADDDPCEQRLCSIDEADCVKRVSEMLACRLRDVRVLEPNVRLLTIAEAEIEVADRIEPLSPLEILDYETYYRGEALFGLMPRDYTYEPPSQKGLEGVVAYYVRETQDIVIITDRVGEEEEDAYATLVHELVHAYQDDRVDLDALSEEHGTTLDRLLALRAIIEGEAELYESLTEIAFADLTPETVNWNRYFDDYQTWALEQAARTETPSLDARRYFPYAYGSEFVTRAAQSGGQAAVDVLFATPPDSVRQVMAGYPAWPDTENNRDDLLDPHAVPVLPEPFAYLGGGHKSVWLLNRMLQWTTSLPDPWAAADLAGVSADYLSVFRDQASGEMVAAWRIQSTTPTVSDFGAWTAQDVDPHPITARAVGEDLLLVATSGPDANPFAEAIEGWQSVADAEASVAMSGGLRLGRPLLPVGHAVRRD